MNSAKSKVLVLFESIHSSFFFKSVLSLILVVISSAEDAAAQAGSKRTVCDMVDNQMVCAEVRAPAGSVGKDKWCRLSEDGIFQRMTVCLYSSREECRKRLSSQRDICLVNPSFVEQSQQTDAAVSEAGEDQKNIALSCSILDNSETSSITSRNIQKSTDYYISLKNSSSIVVKIGGSDTTYHGTLDETSIEFSGRSARGEIESIVINRISGYFSVDVSTEGSKRTFRGSCQKIERKF
jgi:hypothetical protein